MKVGIWLLALALCIGFTSVAHAAKGEKKGLKGKITKVDGAKITIKPGGKNGGGEEVTVTTDDKTSVTLDGKDAKVADLKEGYFASVTPAEGTATSITASTKRPERKKKTDTSTSDTSKSTDSKTTESK